MTEPTLPVRIPVTVLTGFLGAGKTSLLNRLLKEPGFSDTAVIVNEFGAVGIDGDLVEHADGAAFAQTTGCLCCTVAGDIRLTLIRLADAAQANEIKPFSRLIVETTGLADPAPVLHALMNSDDITTRYALNGVATVVDATTGLSTLERFPEARAQAAVADLLLLSKTDLADPAPLRRHLASLTPNARLLDAANATAADVFRLAALDPALRPPAVADWLRFDSHGHDPNRHGADIEAFCYTGAAPVNPWDVQDLIGALQDTLGANLLRMKAICQLDEDPDTPVILHAVQHVLYPPSRRDGWPDGPRETRVIVIARGLDRARVPEIFARHLPGLVPPPAPAHARHPHPHEPV